MDEAPFWIAVNGARRVVLNCTPGGGEALAAGHLLGEGWITGATDLLSLTVQRGPGGAGGADVIIPEPLAAAAVALHEHVVAHGCGLRHYLDCRASPPRVTPLPSPPDPAPLFRELFAFADRAAPQGGVHAAALSTGAELLHGSADVARHCAVDRAIGAGALAGLRNAGLLLTSRISAAMVLKAARADVPWIASRSMATPLARELAAVTGVTLIEQAVRREPPSRSG